MEHRIQQELARHEKMKKLTERIRKDAEDLGDELRKGGDKLNLLLRNTKETLKALNVELTEADTERAQPIVLGTLEEARGPVEGEQAAE